jgi:hypothetical protein
MDWLRIPVFCGMMLCQKNGFILSYYFAVAYEGTAML